MRRRLWPAQLAMGGQPRLKIAQEGEAVFAVGQRIRAVAVGVFVAVKVVLERAVIARDQRGIVAGKPVFGITLRQRPVHHLKALFDHRFILQDQHRHPWLLGRPSLKLLLGWRMVYFGATKQRLKQLPHPPGQTQDMVF